MRGKAEDPPDLLRAIHRRLAGSGKDFLTVKQIRSGLPAALKAWWGIGARDSDRVLANKLALCLDQDLAVYQAGRRRYVGYRLPPEEILLRRIEQHPDRTPAQLARLAPMSRARYVATLNGLLESGAVVCWINERCTVRLRLSHGTGRPAQSVEETPDTGG